MKSAVVEKLEQVLEPKWQTEAEHVLHLAHEARDRGEHDRLRMLDAEAKSLVEDRKARTVG